MATPKASPSAKKPSKAGAAPPFTPDAAAVADWPAKRSVTGTSTGVTVDEAARPDAELNVTYKTQFRFYRFWQTRVPTPAWFGTGESSDLPARIEKAPHGDVVLDADERLCQFDVKDQTTVRVGKQTLSLQLGESEKRSLPYWFPAGAKLPPEVRVNDPKWKPPQKQPNSSPDNQWGLRGDFQFRTTSADLEANTRNYKMVTVWQRWKDDRKCYTGEKPSKGAAIPPMCTQPLGIYAGYVRVMGNHQSQEERAKYPAIWIGYTWNADASEWGLGVLGWVLKNPQSTKPTTSIFIHPGNFPNWFLGCMAPGPAEKQTEWGFKSKDDTSQAMWDILAAVGVKKKEYIETTKYLQPDKKHRKWFLIRVKAGSPSVVAADGWKDCPIWV